MTDKIEAPLPHSQYHSPSYQRPHHHEFVFVFFTTHTDPRIAYYIASLLFEKLSNSYDIIYNLRFAL